MSTTNYPGIDYSHGQSNRDAETGIRFGVISQHSVRDDVIGDVYYGPHSQDLAFNGHLMEVKNAITAALNECSVLRDAFRADDLERIIESACDEADEHIGNAYEGDTDPLYEHDGYKIVKCLDNDLMILKSPWYTYAQFCSPCVPGAGNLNHPFDPMDASDISVYATQAVAAGFQKVFCLDHDWFEGSIAPYHVFCVETNEQVHPITFGISKPTTPNP